MRFYYSGGIEGFGEEFGGGSGEGNLKRNI